MIVYILFKFGEIVGVFGHLGHAQQEGVRIRPDTKGWDLWPGSNQWDSINDDNGTGAMSIQQFKVK
jgi:hypothetical protein